MGLSAYKKWSKDQNEDAASLGRVPEARNRCSDSLCFERSIRNRIEFLFPEKPERSETHVPQRHNDS